MYLESPLFIHQMFIKSLLLTRHHGGCWSYSSERVCDLKELKVYMVKTSNKQINAHIIYWVVISATKITNKRSLCKRSAIWT